MADGAQSGKNLVLIAEDESLVLRLITTVLSGAGYRAIVVTDGLAGYEKFQEFRDEICLVLTDVIMPRGGGIDMALKMRELDPSVKILFMSGYSDAAQEVEARTNYPFIRKPFLPADLLRKIDAILIDTGTLGASQS
jgi:two-component system cell cycle sensor histidine kinase/response regulator CckA